ncbi:MAG: cbb3-type cytochrome c oxidase subunit I [Thermomicrobiales bacterium]|nr:cbb3-type cytochrome c oxidase subunit I [Thermomicrobiales bacterium]
MAAALAAVSPLWPTAWSAAMTLAILGGIVPMIAAVNIRVVPVFTRRQWRSEQWLRVQNTLMVAGAWIVAAGWLWRLGSLVTLGSAVALAGGVAFVTNVALLIRQPIGKMPALPLPFPEQGPIDRVGTGFMRLSGIYLLFGLAVGLMRSVWTPPVGRWDLVWAHALLIGFFVSMAAGVSYHVLSRWTGAPWRWTRPIRWHLELVRYGLPFMVLALATGWTPLFAVAGVVQALALLIFVVNLVPMIPVLPELTRPAFAAAALLISIGVTLGAWFALDPAVGARLRQAHAELNVFGFAGLLISGTAFYLIPRFAGRPLRWPRLAATQLALLGGGVALTAVGWAWRGWAGGPLAIIAVGQALVVIGFVLFGAIMFGTFTRAGSGAVSAATIQSGKSVASRQPLPVHPAPPRA